MPNLFAKPPKKPPAGGTPRKFVETIIPATLPTEELQPAIAALTAEYEQRKARGQIKEPAAHVDAPVVEAPAAPTKAEVKAEEKAEKKADAIVEKIEIKADAVVERAADQVEAKIKATVPAGVLDAAGEEIAAAIEVMRAARKRLAELHAAHPTHPIWGGKAPSRE